MAGYSGTPLIKKIGIKDHHHVLILNPPEDFDSTLGELPPSVRRAARVTEQLDVILCFTRSVTDMKKRFSPLTDALVVNGMLWICWPKKASGVVTDLNENVIREIGLAKGLVEVKVCAIDEIWSGLKFVRRKADRG